jgi:hypothetical protein
MFPSSGEGGNIYFVGSLRTVDFNLEYAKTSYEYAKTPYDVSKIKKYILFRDKHRIIRDRL